MYVSFRHRNIGSERRTGHFYCLFTTSSMAVGYASSSAPNPKVWGYYWIFLHKLTICRQKYTGEKGMVGIVVVHTYS
jgi:hypothetical protein